MHFGRCSKDRDHSNRSSHRRATPRSTWCAATCCSRSLCTLIFTLCTVCRKDTGPRYTSTRNKARYRRSQLNCSLVQKLKWYPFHFPLPFPTRDSFMPSCTTCTLHYTAIYYVQTVQALGARVPINKPPPALLEYLENGKLTPCSMSRNGHQPSGRIHLGSWG